MEYCVCEEKINGQWSGCYTVRINSDCNSARFRIIERFSSFEEANFYINAFLND